MRPVRPVRPSQLGWPRFISQSFPPSPGRDGAGPHTESQHAKSGFQGPKNTCSPNGNVCCAPRGRCAAENALRSNFCSLSGHLTDTGHSRTHCSHSLLTLTAHTHCSRSLTFLCASTTARCATHRRSCGQLTRFSNSAICRIFILNTEWVAECFLRGCSEAWPTVWEWTENRLLSIHILAPPTPPASSDTRPLSLP